MVDLLTALSGIAWTLVYIDSVRIGFKRRTFAIPAFALALNVTWEAIYSYIDLSDGAGLQSIVDVAWLVLDVGICVTFVLYGARYWPKALPKALFYVWAALMLVTAFACQLSLIAQFGKVDAGVYSAFLQNLIMSVMFVSMFIARGGREGQTMLIATAKCVGTLAPTITFGFIGGYALVQVMGVGSFVFDVIYIGLLYWGIRRPDIDFAAFRGPSPKPA